MNQKYERLIYGFLLSVSIILTLYPFFQIGFTIWDDMEYYMVALRGNFHEDAVNNALRSGRFYHFLVKPFYSFAYIFDNFYITKLVQHASLILSYILFALVIRKIFKSGYFALITFLMLITFTSVTSNYHIPFISYPFYFTFSFSLILLSLLLFLKYTETSGNKYLVFSALVYLCGVIFFEIYVEFLLLMILFILIRSWKLRGLKASFKDKQFYREILPFIGIILVYAIAYLSFNIYNNIHNPDQKYTGNILAANFSLANFFTVLFHTNRAAYPTILYQYHYYQILSNSLLLSGHIDSIWYIIKHSEISALVNALIQCFLFVMVYLKMKFDISWKKVGIAGVLAFLYSLACHFLIAITEKYNASWYEWMNGYVTTYFAYFGIMLIVALITYAGIKLLNFHKITRYIGIGIFTIALFCLSLITQYSNDHLARDYRHVQNNFFMMDEMIKENAFDFIPENALVYAADLNRTASLLMSEIGESVLDWGEYIELKSGRKMELCFHAGKMNELLSAEPDRDVFVINKAESRKSQDVFMAISKINPLPQQNGPGEDLLSKLNSSDTRIYYYSPLKEFLLGVALSDTISGSFIILNEQDTVSAVSGANIISIKNDNLHRKITSARLRTDGVFVPGYFLVSDINTLKDLE